MERKPGGYRKPTEEQRRMSMIPKDKFDKWFQQFWTITGASTKEHPAPYPLELASRLMNENTSLFGHAQLQIDLKPCTVVESALLLKESPSEYNPPKKRAQVVRRKL